MILRGKLCAGAIYRTRLLRGLLRLTQRVLNLSSALGLTASFDSTLQASAGLTVSSPLTVQIAGQSTITLEG